jgi:predicted ABC-type exoprotein transport system permease subunit
MQVACMSALSGVVATYLKDASYDPVCLLNLDGDVCTFCYVTTMVSLLISCGILIGFLLVDYTLIKPLLDVVVGSSIFLAFWQFVMALTIQIRGNQATSAGYPGTSARQGSYAMAWIAMVCSLVVALAAAVLIYLARPKKKKVVKGATRMAVPNQAVAQRK